MGSSFATLVLFQKTLTQAYDATHQIRLDKYHRTIVSIVLQIGLLIKENIVSIAFFLH